MPNWDSATYNAFLSRRSPVKPSADKNAITMAKESRVSTDEDKLNKLERAYLAYLRSQGFTWIGIQNVTLKLAHDCRLTVDFVVFDARGGIFIDVKGFQREDALIKMKIAARLFPFWTFQIVKRENGVWAHETVKP